MANKRNSRKRRSSPGSQPEVPRKSARIAAVPSDEDDEVDGEVEILDGPFTEGSGEELLTPEELAELEDDPDANVPSQEDLADISSDEEVPAAILPTKPPITLKLGVHSSASNSKARSSQSSKAVKVRKAKGARAKSSKKRKLSDVDQSDGEEDQVEAKRPRIVLLVPLAESDAIQRVNIPWESTFDDVVQTIHDTIPCTTVKKKPILSYKIGPAAQKGSSYALKTDENWGGCLELVREEFLAKAKKQKGSTDPVPPVQISIELGPKEYLESLRSHNKKGKATATTKSRKKTKGVNLLDLDGDDEFGIGDQDDDNDDADLMENERRQLEILDGVLSNCQLCGPNVFCKIDKLGSHVKLTIGQRKGWAKALALGAREVTLRTPPKAPMFDAFHATQKSRPLEPAVYQPGHGNAYGPPPAWQGMYPLPPYYFPPPPFQPHPQGGPLAGPSQLQAPERTKSISSESDAPPGVSYPGIYEFFERLFIDNPGRPLLQTMADTLQEQEIYTLWEISRLGKEKLQKNLGLKIGTASFIVDAVNREIKRCVRTHKENQFEKAV